MPILYILVGLAALGFALWFVNNKVNMDSTVKWWVNVVVIGLVILWVLRTFGVWDALLTIRV